MDPSPPQTSFCHSCGAEHRNTESFCADCGDHVFGVPFDCPGCSRSFSVLGAYCVCCSSAFKFEELSKVEAKKLRDQIRTQMTQLTNVLQRLGTNLGDAAPSSRDLGSGSARAPPPQAARPPAAAAVGLDSFPPADVPRPAAPVSSAAAPVSSSLPPGSPRRPTSYAPAVERTMQQPPVAPSPPPAAAPATPPLRPSYSFSDKSGSSSPAPDIYSPVPEAPPRSMAYSPSDPTYTRPRSVSVPTPRVSGSPLSSGYDGSRYGSPGVGGPRGFRWSARFVGRTNYNVELTEDDRTARKARTEEQREWVTFSQIQTVQAMRPGDRFRVCIDEPCQRERNSLGMVIGLATRDIESDGKAAIISNGSKNFGVGFAVNNGNLLGTTQRTGYTACNMGDMITVAMDEKRNLTFELNTKPIAHVEAAVLKGTKDFYPTVSIFEGKVTIIDVPV